MIMFMLVAVFLYIAVTAALCFLQIFLSRKKSKWPGLILPMLFVLLSLIVTITNLRLISPNSYLPEENNTIQYDENGNIVEKIEKVDSPRHSYTTHSSSGAVISWVGLIFIFTAMNIPTVIYLFIYGISREKMRSKLEMQKMAIQDLN